MNKRNTIIIAASIAVVIIGAILFSFFRKSDDQPTISLPKPDSEFGVDGESGLISVNPDNVQTVLAYLTRTETYSREYSITSYWENGESTATVKVWQNGSLMRIDHNQNKVTKTTPFTADTVYRWYNNSTSISAVSLADYDVNLLDRYARLITYEELINIPVPRITAADYEQKLDENCIYIQYESEDKHYVNHIFVSVDTGLLVAAEILEDEKIVYSMNSVATNLAAPEESVFIPPTT